MRRPLASLLAAGALLTMVSQTALPGAAAPAGCDGGRVLNVLPHHDDDLLFLSPDLLHDLKSDKCVQSVFLIASDYRDPEYMTMRERGVRVAYANAVGLPESAWRAAPYAVGGVAATKWSLGDGRVSIVENRISDTSTAPLNQLWRLYANNTALTTKAGDHNTAQRLDRPQVQRYLTELIGEYGPDTIRTLDPTADHHGHAPEEFHGYHRDHVAVTRLLQSALDAVAEQPEVVYYRDYTAKDGAPNLSASDSAIKRKAFVDFAMYDRDICGPGSDPAHCPPAGGFYDQFMTRTHQADEHWTGDSVVPLPSRTTTPVMGRSYRVVNRATGLELAVLDAAQTDGAGVIAWAATGTANQRFRVEATPGGWALIASHSGKCLDLPESNQESGVQVTQFKCTGNTNQALRLNGNEASGYVLSFAHSGKALAVGGTGRGAPVVQRSDSTERWDLVS
jgi:hypothetical protein